ncbi:MAG TPA: DinB family protein [Pyrinomonadaceae bacterium]|nr:DinB family protein [Pyrinomonadaceae bacterium]
MSVERYILSPAPGVTPGIGFYLGALEEVREQLDQIVRDMSNDQIARRAVPGANPIGALVLHIGEAEWWWMQCIVAGHELTEEDRQAPYWDVLDDPEGFAARGYSARYCLEVIGRIREQSRDLLARFSDEDLERIVRRQWRERTIEASLRWVLHHLVDHEAQHKGQILMLKRLLGADAR